MSRGQPPSNTLNWMEVDPGSVHSQLFSKTDLYYMAPLEAHAIGYRDVLSNFWYLLKLKETKMGTMT